MQSRETWGFGMAPSHAMAGAQSRLKELCAIISEATGVTFTPRHAPSYRELADGIRRGDVGIAWMPPIPTIELEEEGAAITLALPWRLPCRFAREHNAIESSSYYSAIVTREAPRERTKAVADLQGMRVAWVDRESAAGYLVPRMHLAALGIDARTFFAQETFARSHLGVIDAVVSGAADVGATFCTLDPGTKRVMTAGWTAADGSKIRDVNLVVTLGPIPNDAIVASSRVPATIRSSLARWLLAPDERSQDLLAELFQVRSFRVARFAHFDELRHMVRAAKSRGYGS